MARDDLLCKTALYGNARTWGRVCTLCLNVIWPELSLELNTFEASCVSTRFLLNQNIFDLLAPQKKVLFSQ